MRALAWDRGRLRYTDHTFRLLRRASRRDWQTGSRYHPPAAYIGWNRMERTPNRYRSSEDHLHPQAQGADRLQGRYTLGRDHQGTALPLVPLLSYQQSAHTSALKGEELLTDTASFPPHLPREAILIIFRL